MKDSYSGSYAAAGVDITAGYKAVELMKEHIRRTNTAGVLSGIGGRDFNSCTLSNIAQSRKIVRQNHPCAHVTPTFTPRE